MIVLDLTADFLLLDLLETITYYQRVNETTYADPVTMLALRFENQKHLIDGQQHTSGLMNEPTWCVGNAGMSSPVSELKCGDKFTDVNNVTFVVETAHCDRAIGQWELRCFKGS